jgi:hypothetical protein
MAAGGAAAHARQVTVKSHHAHQAKSSEIKRNKAKSSAIKHHQVTVKAGSSSTSGKICRTALHPLEIS